MKQSFDIKTGDNRLKLILNMFSSVNQTITVKSKDKDHKECVYFDTDVDLHAGDNTEVFRMPLSPDNLIVEIHSDSPVVLKGISTQYYPINAMSLHPEDELYLERLEAFAKECAYLKPERYVSPDGKTIFNYMERIKDEPQTPARVDHNSPVGETDFSKYHLKDYTVPMIVAIGMHERKHWTTGTENETQADLSGIKVLLDRGYPKMELLHATTRVLPSEDQYGQPIINNINRALAVRDFINDYQN